MSCENIYKYQDAKNGMCEEADAVSGLVGKLFKHHQRFANKIATSDLQC